MYSVEMIRSDEGMGCLFLVWLWFIATEAEIPWRVWEVTILGAYNPKPDAWIGVREAWI